MISNIVQNGIGFNPRLISGLALWLDAFDLSTLALDGSNNVSQWRDKSGNSNHGNQATSTWRPFGFGSINGKNALDFDGINDFLSISNSSSINLGPTMSFFAVHKINLLTARQTIFSFQDGNNQFTPMLEMGSATGTYTNSYSVIRPSVFMINAPNNSLTTSSSLFSFLIESSQNLTIRKNGSQIATTASAGTTLTGSGQQKLIGSRTTASQFFFGSVGEIIVYNRRLSVSEILQIETYLLLKWLVV